MYLYGVTRIFVCFQLLHKLMHRSNRNFKPSPPRAYPGHLTVHRARGGEFERCLGRVGNFDPWRGNLNKVIFKSSNTWGIA